MYLIVYLESLYYNSLYVQSCLLCQTMEYILSFLRFVLFHNTSCVGYTILSFFSILRPKGSTPPSFLFFRGPPDFSWYYKLGRSTHLPFTRESHYPKETLNVYVSCMIYPSKFLKKIYLTCLRYYTFFEKDHSNGPTPSHRGKRWTSFRQTKSRPIPVLSFSPLYSLLSTSSLWTSSRLNLRDSESKGVVLLT